MHAACVLFMLACNYRARAHHCGTAHDAAFPENAGDAGLGRSDPPCACQSDWRMPCACHDAKISMIRMLLHENVHAFACTGLAAHASEGLMNYIYGINHINHDTICNAIPMPMTVHRLRTRIVF